MTRHLLLFFVFFWHITSYANDECSNAIQLTPGAACNSTSGTFNGMTFSGAVPTCAPNSSQDVWYKFTATQQTMSVSLSRASTSTTMYLAMEIYEDNCTGSRFKCIAPDSNAIGYFHTDFVIGRTYYVRVLNPSATITTLGFNICVQAFSKPANDTCATAALLTPGSGCVNTFGTFSGALFDGAVPSCAANSSQDVWYKFTATEQTMSVSLARASTNTTMYLAMEIYEDSCTGNRFKCIATDSNAIGYFHTDFVVGRTYYVRVLNPGAIINTLGFNICVQAFPKPANDTCANAAVLIPGSSCVNTFGTFSGALFDGAVPSCAANSSQDVWYKFTATEQTMSVSLARASTNTTMYLAMEIYEDSCTGNRFKCIATDSNAVGYFHTDFVVGRTYYVRVLNPGAIINTLGFNICVQAFPKPANDTCANAAVLTPGSSCVNTFGTFSGALFDGAVPSCAANSSQDVWYKFTATEQTMSVSLARASTNTMMYLAMEIYEDSCTGNRFKCIATDSNAIGYFHTDFVVGRTYYVRVLNPGAIINTLGFNICVQALPKPANDTCATAQQLTPGANCINTVGTFSGALLDGAVSSCAANSSQDVWYWFTATQNTMSVAALRASTNTTMYLAMEIYENSCNGFIFKCLASQTNTVSYFNTDFVIGRTYYVRVLNPGTAITTLDFNICVQAFPKPDNDTCATAAQLIPGDGCVNIPGVLKGALLDGAIPSCATNSSQDVWYKFMATEKTMSISVSRVLNSTMYFAMEIYEDSCTGNRFKCIAPQTNSVSYFNSDFVIGRTYYVRVLNASSEITTLGFNICLRAFPKPVNDTCATATELTPATTCENIRGTLIGALLDGDIPSCATNSSQDVWYKFTATGQTMSVNVVRAGLNAPMDLAMEIYEVSCAGNRLQCIPPSLNSLSYSNNNFVVGRTYYVRVLNPTSTVNILSFNICLVGPPPVTCTPAVIINTSTTSVCQGEVVVFTATPTHGGTTPAYQWKVNGNDVGVNSPSYSVTTLANGDIVSCVLISNAACAFPIKATSNAITMSIVATTVPVFTQVAPICSGETFTLPTISNNGISGTWSPAINNTASRTYTFTPTSGQCVTQATMAVIVHSINAETTVQGSTITASATGATYQWINCANNQPISGATNASFVASANGSYAVIVTRNGCSVTSNCVQITNLGIDTFVKNGLKVYPNPATHQLFIQVDEATEIVIVDMTGKTIQKQSLKTGNNTIDVSPLESGMYFIKSVSGANAKFVKK